MKPYSTISLAVTSPTQSFTEPLTLAEVKSFLGLPVRFPEELAEDATLDLFISGARRVAEVLQGRDLVVKQYELRADYFDCEIELRTPLHSVAAIEYRNSEGTTTSVIADTEYMVDLARGIVRPAYGTYWPSFTAWPSGAVLVRFSSGLSPSDPFWADDGKSIKIGMLHLVSAWFNGRLPFEPSSIEIREYPYTVTSLLSFGAVPSVR